MLEKQFQQPMNRQGSQAFFSPEAGNCEQLRWIRDNRGDDYYLATSAATPADSPEYLLIPWHARLQLSGSPLTTAS